MKRQFKLAVLFAFLCIGMFSCTNSEAGNATESKDRIEGNVTDLEATETKETTFENYLQFFFQNEKLDNWSSELMSAMYSSPDFYGTDAMRMAFLKSKFSLLQAGYSKFIPTNKIVNLDPIYSKDIHNPASSYEYWAVKKLKHEDYWLVSILAVKKDRVDQEFNAHPFLLVSYNPNGKVLDSYVWTFFADDTEQIWDDIAVDGDKLVRGFKENNKNPTFTEVYEKVNIKPDGKFEIVPQK
jgi:hypothetical protein